MSDSQASGKLSINRDQYSSLKNITKAQISSLVAEGEQYVYLLKQLNSVQQCQQIWSDFRKTDFYSNGLISVKFMEFIMTKNQQSVIQNNFSFLICQEFKMLMSYLRFLIETKMGIFNLKRFLNQDDQLEIFSVIKEKIVNIATNLRKVYQYELFKQLMKIVRFMIIKCRQMEQEINKYQNQVRLQMNEKEIVNYQQVGQEKVQDFYEQYYDEFQRLNNQKEEKIKQLTLQQLDEISQLEEKLLKPVLNIKPKKKLKEYQIQEKLVSIEERVDEAIDFRRELKVLEVKEAERVEKQINEISHKERRKLKKKQEKEMNELSIKLQNEEFNLIIKLKKEYDILLKKVALHKNQIQNIHVLETKNAFHQGEYESEFKRRKNNFKTQNQIIKESKINGFKTFNNFNNQDDDDNKSNLTVQSTNKKHLRSVSTKQDFKKLTNVQQLKQIQKNGNITIFNVCHDMELEPINKQKRVGQQVDNHFKIQKMLQNQDNYKHKNLPNITKLYDNNLNLIQVDSGKKTKDQLALQKEESLKKKIFIEQILNPDK